MTYPPDHWPADSEPQPPASAPPHRPVPPRQPRRGMLIGAIALAAVLVITAGGLTAWLLLRDADRNGPASPTVAIESFLRAVYQDHDASEANALVCAEARDEAALSAKINSIEEYAAAYEGPRFTWSEPELVDQTEELAVMDVTITMITSDEQLAEQALRISVLDKEAHGWWVCNVDSTPEVPGDANGATDGDDEAGSEETADPADDGDEGGDGE